MSSDNTSASQDVSPASSAGDSPAATSSRTQRRVQWASKTRVEHFEQVPSRPESDEEDQEEHARTLDEHGSDPAALARLHQALESYLHPQTRPSTSKPAPWSKHTRRREPTDTSVPVSIAAQSHGESSRRGAQQHQDLDERVYVEAGETVGLPLPHSARAQEETQDGGDEEIEVEEQGREEEKMWEKRARSLVRAHTKSDRRQKAAARVQDSESTQGFRRLASLRRGTNPLLDEKGAFPQDRDLESNTGTNPTQNITPLPLGRGHGVLSTLLALYDAGGSGSASSSAPTSRATSPTGSEREHDAIPEDREGEQEQERAPPTSYFELHPPVATDMSPPPHPVQEGSSSAPSTPSAPRKHKNTFHIPIPTPSSAALSLHLPSPGKNVHLPKLHTPGTRGGRPKAATNAGGVIGTLIATSGNLTGAAAPIPSTVGPNVGRRGWGLTRYELAPDDTQFKEHHRRTRSAPTTPQPSSTSLSETDYFNLPAPGTTGTATPDSTSSAATPRTNGGPARKPMRTSLATLVEWLPHSLPSRPGSRASSPHEKGVTGDDASSMFDVGRENGKAYRRGRKERRRKAEIFITKHVAEVMQRQEFLLKLARALMMFAAPSHRLQAQIQATARVLDLEASTLYLPNVMLISFGDAATSTSNLKFIQQGSSLDLGKLLDAHRLYWKVIHDKISVSSASASLDFLMRKPPLYRGWQVVLLGGLCSSSICSLAFSGSFVDSLVVLPLGSLLVLVQNFSARNELYSNVFEITIATLLSFISAGLASTTHFCYAALASSSVVLILPGFIVLSGSLELASRQIISGAVRICFAVIYSLFLGFGIAMGADVYSRITGLSVVGPDDYTCGSSHHSDGPWWQRTASIWWAFLCVPLYSLFLSLRNQAPLLRKEMVVTIIISCGGWAANHFAGVAFAGRPDIQSALGAFAVGIVANIYAKFFSGNAYVVMITGILFQLPSGLANGGLLTFAAVDNKGQQFQSYQAGFQVALQLVAVAIGLTVGLFTSVVIVHPLGGSRRRAAGLFSL